MPGPKLLPSALVMAGLVQFGRQRTKTITRLAVMAGCRLGLRWLSHAMPPPRGCAVVIAPHPDDETLACGALIARRRAGGLPVHVIVVTDGSASHPNHPTLTSPRLRAVRRDEARAALAVLGVESVAAHFLDEVDGTLGRLPPERVDDLADRLRSLLEAIQPDEVFLPCCPDGSSEHDATYAVAQRALAAVAKRPAIWEYPVWSWWNPKLILGRLGEARRCWSQATEDFGPVKDHALACYRSQFEPCAPWLKPLVPPGLVELLRSDREYFFRVELPPSHPVQPPRAV
ncbi:MAG: PIG-L family deacetylase [Verrucomicrobia bacterium]|nr:PIG-L family deacetylase [Verrucomicrobiota bacterium]